MGKYITILFVTLFLSIVISLLALDIVNAQTIDNLSSAIVFLSNQTKDRIDFGTGFFIYNDKTIFLVTADHVSQSLSSSSDITVRTVGDKPYSFKFSNISNVTNQESILPWIRHKEADIAILPLFPDSDLIKGVLKNHFLSVSYLYDGKESISRDTTLTILGFPLALGLQGYFSPISRETKPASGFLVLKRFDTKQPSTFFITQDPSVGGFSGAPVFDLMLPRISRNTIIGIQGKPMIVGIVHGTLADDTGGKFGAITPSFFIKELIDSYEANK